MAGIFTASWNGVRHTVAFSTDGHTSSDPSSAPRLLPTGSLTVLGPTSAQLAPLKRRST